MKLYNIVILILFSCSALAQENVEEKRNWIVGGALKATVQNNSYPSSSYIPTPPRVGGIFSSFNSEFRSASYAFLPYIGKELGEHWMMGLELGYVRRTMHREVVTTIIVPPFPAPTQTEEECLKEVSNAFRIGVFERFTFNPTQKFQLFSQFNIVYTSAIFYEEVANFPNIEGDASYIDIGLDLGANYRFVEKWRAAVWIGALSYYNGAWESSAGFGNHFSAFSFDLDPAQLRIGLEYLF